MLREQVSEQTQLLQISLTLVGALIILCLVYWFMQPKCECGGRWKGGEQISSSDRRPYRVCRYVCRKCARVFNLDDLGRWWEIKGDW